MNSDIQAGLDDSDGTGTGLGAKDEEGPHEMRDVDGTGECCHLDCGAVGECLTGEGAVKLGEMLFKWLSLLA